MLTQGMVVCRAIALDLPPCGRGARGHLSRAGAIPVPIPNDRADVVRRGPVLHTLSGDQRARRAGHQPRRICRDGAADCGMGAVPNFFAAFLLVDVWQWAAT